MIILISRLLTTLLSTAPTTRNIANPLDGLSLPYEKTKILTLTTLYLLNIIYINGSPVLYIINKATRF
jgi:hypothetical protein